MKIKLVQKSISRRSVINSTIIEIENCKTMRDIIAQLVEYEITNYENLKFKKTISPLEIDQMKKNGKITFGFDYIKHDKIILEEAIYIAIQAINDGVVRIFINKAEIVDIEENICLNELDEITLIKLTMMTGLY